MSADELPYQLPYYLGYEQQEAFSWDDWVSTYNETLNVTSGVKELLRKHGFRLDDAFPSLHACANGWVGASWPEHITEVISTYNSDGSDPLL